MSSIFQKAESHFTQQLPFVLYCKPNSTVLNAIFQQNSQLFFSKDLSEKGFVFADFSGKLQIVFLESSCEIASEALNFANADFNKIVPETSEEGKMAFEKLVEKGIADINDGAFKKVVLSRKETVENTEFQFLKTFEKMLATYSTAFRYCWFHPEIGMWMGATPEQLLKIEHSAFKTVALAGTQKWQLENEAIWEEKEKQEQQYVTDFIIMNLEPEAISIEKSQPYSFQAGSLIHLKTDISGVLKADFNLQKIIKNLHPTPAVCGLPKESSLHFIMENEGYDRKFYAGFLGEINSDRQGDSNLYVNLRCMEIAENQINIYVGCGITKDSNPEKEYIETANKAMTMKQILN